MKKCAVEFRCGSRQIEASETKENPGSTSCLKQQQARVEMLELSELIFAISICIKGSISIYLLQLSGIPKPPLRPSRFVVPRPPTPPVDRSSAPYNEDLIISFITDFYDLLINIGYLPSDSVIFPHATCHRINIALCESLHIDPAVISLMKRTTYTNHRVNDWEQLEYPVFQGGWMYNFLKDENILQR